MTPDDEEPDLSEVLDEINRLEAKFMKLSDDYTNLREEVNELERTIERRT